MSEVNSNSKDNAWGPPVFSAAGRFQTNTSDVTDNYNKQIAEQNSFQQERDDQGHRTQAVMLSSRCNRT
ncbi:hypothetical protein BUE60_09835 [Pseudomonas syringae pv. actinidiae]|uniref:hypothetical protein n=1 Tax=Pseudomonas syringae TaxID=317 RepID=UPI000BB58D72|nr:hypothetical protein [Pseudomonas syringae]PBK47473.1 hypothetical protein BUE61_29400 [Pseudomonas syringae pv. actinidiae]PBK54462.1 hypothetical protein BUE60_09835 [Pseudomonas syringae pv. actinidiae]